MTDRFDLYSAVHKGLRSAMQAVSLRLGQLDPDDAADVTGTLEELREVLSWLEEHLRIENDFVHTAIEARRPGALLARLRDDHSGHERAFSLLRADAEGLERSFGQMDTARAARARRLYLAFSTFVGENLVHMALEETDGNALLWELFTDEELSGIGQVIQSRRAPEQVRFAVRWMLPALNPAERATLLLRARKTMPPELFDQLLGQLLQGLSAKAGEKLEVALAAA